MKAIIKLLLAIIIVLGLASPYFVGKIVEKDFHQLIERINAAHQNELKVTATFNRGYFSSTATTQVTFTNSYSAFQLAHFIQHGPVIFNFNGWFSPSTYVPRGYKMAVINTKFAGNQEQMLTGLYGGKTPYEILTSISMQGDIDTAVTNFPITLNLGMGTLNWQGFKANIHTSMDFENVNGDLLIPLIEYAEAITPEFKQSVNVANINVTFKEQITAENANVAIDIDSIKIMVNDAEELSLQKYTFSVDRQVLNNMLNVDLDKNFAKLAIGSDSYGPFNVELKLKNWNAIVTRQLMQEPEPMPAPAPGAAPEPVPPIAAMVPDDQILELLASKIGMELNLSLVSPDGNLIIKMQSELGGPGITKLEAAQILPTLTSTNHIEISRKVLHKVLMRYADNQIKNREVAYYLTNKTSTIKNPYTLAPEERKTIINTWINEAIAQLIAKNLIVPKGEDYISDVNFTNNVMTINGSVKSQADLDQFRPTLEVIPPVTPLPAPAPPTPSNVPSEPAVPGASTSGTSPIPVVCPSREPATPPTATPPAPAPVTPTPPVTSNPGPSTPSGPSVTSVTNVKE